MHFLVGFTHWVQMLDSDLHEGLLCLFFHWDKRTSVVRCDVTHVCVCVDTWVRRVWLGPRTPNPPLYTIIQMCDVTAYNPVPRISMQNRQSSHSCKSLSSIWTQWLHRFCTLTEQNLENSNSSRYQIVSLLQICYVVLVEVNCKPNVNSVFCHLSTWVRENCIPTNTPSVQQWSWDLYCALFCKVVEKRTDTINKIKHFVLHCASQIPGSLWNCIKF